MFGKTNDVLTYHQIALAVRAQRQQVLASNIANADTPNYKARDIDFAQALQNALNEQGANNNLGVAKTAKAHLDGNKTASMLGGTPLLYRTVTQGSVDGNTVDMDVERNQFVDNALRYEAGVTLANGQLKTLLTAVQG
ncbi:MAG: flagellar basal body rod protein FlgB [Oxalobacter sp.]|nr:MAG: flagellar basal body rod protein FlgB [Oxalobacter sp.]